MSHNFKFGNPAFTPEPDRDTEHRLAHGAAEWISDAGNQETGDDNDWDDDDDDDWDDDDDDE